MEFVRMGVVYFHLIACCIAIGTIFGSDWAIARSLLRGDPEHALDTKHLDSLQTTISVALAVLWLTGLGLCAIDISAKGYEVMQNPKLQAKIALVLVLTLNGVFLLHRRVLPAMKRTRSLLHMNAGTRRLCLFAGAVSAVSWFYAAMLGIGRPLNFKYSLVQILGAFPALIVGGMLAMSALIAWASYRDRAQLQPSVSLGA